MPTPRLELPYIVQGQAQKEVTHNDALVRLDALVDLYILDRDLAAPPGSLADGDAYIVAPSPTGAWAGQGGNIAYLIDGAWRFYAPVKGLIAYIADEQKMLVFTTTGWVDLVSILALQNLSKLGILTAGDNTNRLAVKSDAVLLSHDDVTPGTGSVQLKLNKAAATDTASVLYQTGWSGRAEFGLTGDDDFNLKVSADGAAWRDAMKFDRASGRVSFPSGGVRELLADNRAYYVRTDGSDANNGLTSTAGGAFKTLQRAWDAVIKIDLNGFAVTIQVGAGTYAAGVLMTVPPLGGNVMFLGDTATPANVVISTTAANVFDLQASTIVTVKGFKIQTTTSGDCIAANSAGAVINYGNIEFGAATRHLRAANFGVVQNNAFGDCTISGNAIYHFSAAAGGMVLPSNYVTTISGSRSFANGFAQSATGQVVSVGWIASGGSVSGARYLATMNGIINVFGGGANYFPGSVAGSVATGGQYA